MKSSDSSDTLLGKSTHSIAASQTKEAQKTLVILKNLTNFITVRVQKRPWQGEK